jgi:hypothetical protein
MPPHAHGLDQIVDRAGRDAWLANQRLEAGLSDLGLRLRGRNN